MACVDEDQAIAFVDGNLALADRARIETHVDECEMCRCVLAELVRHDVVAEWTPGARIGRYALEARIGRGGMGAVWRAYDAELSRAVALKRVHAGAGDDERARLVREARVAAQLQHPNVVAVYEVGEERGEPFLAMELVDGETLARWLETSRSTPTIVGVLVQAGRGLAAAHAQGLVHRDFKPQNVLVDRNGRVRVADFGLARAEGLAVGERVPADGRALSSLTETGTLSGTPAYIAPELVEGARPDARSDQYAFAVTAFEALYGRHPFAGATVEAKWLEMAAGRIDWPRRSRIPTRFARIVERALAVDPAARWPNVDAFADALAGALRPRVAWALGGAVIAIAVVCAIVVAVSTRTAPKADCDSGAELVDTVWSAPARATLGLAFAGREGELAATTRLVDDWTGAWRLGRHAACHVAPPEVAARVACLDRALGALRAQLAAWPTADAAAIARGVDAVAGLPRPDDCADHAPQLGSSPKLDERVARVVALDALGRDRDARPQVDALVSDTEASGDPGVLARALVAAGRVEAALGERERARDHDARAARESARAMDDVTTLAALLDEARAATDSGRPADALGLCDAAEALVVRAKLARQDRVVVARADALEQLGRAPEAIAAYRQAIAIIEKSAKSDRTSRLDLASALGALGGAYMQEARSDEARAELARALAIEELERGPDDPELARTLHDLALAELQLGHDANGIADLERARRIFAKTYGERSESVAMCDVLLADHARVTRHCDQAVPIYQRASAELPPDLIAQAVIETSLGSCARDVDDERGAADHFARSLAIYAKIGETGSAVGDTRADLGMALVALGDDVRARHEAEQALVEFERANVEPAGRVEAWRLLAEIEHRANHKAHAVELERRVVAAIPLDSPPEYLAVRDDAQAQITAWSRSP